MHENISLVGAISSDCAAHTIVAYAMDGPGKTDVYII